MTVDRNQDPNRKFFVTEPGRTAGQAEGKRSTAAPYDPRQDPGRTPGQAEGEQTTAEIGTSSAAQAVGDPQKSRKSGAHGVRSRSREIFLRSLQQPETVGERLRLWGILLAGGWLILYGVRRALTPLAIAGLGSLLIYYALHGEWPTHSAQ